MSGEEARQRIRRRILASMAGALAAPGLAVQAQPAGSPAEPKPGNQPPVGTRYAPVVPGRRLRFPEDHGSHPLFRLEWWYLTGWVEAPGLAAAGFQVTFFRIRPEIDERNPSAFSPRQLVIAHAALSEPSRTRLAHDQKVARAALGLAGADEGRMRTWIDNWSLAEDGGGYRALIPARGFSFDFALTPAQPLLLQGDAGYSRKGPRPESASYYYSVPHLQVAGLLTVGERRSEVRGAAWLDHEWSSSLMDERAVGWDWIGINFDDGSVLMAFRMRDRNAGSFWAAATHRTREGVVRTFTPDEIEFTPMRTWRSPRTGVRYPVAFRVRTGTLEITVEPLMDDQEYDTRASVGTIYWEGAVRALRAGQPAGRGYLELTGYWRPMKL